MQNPLNNKYSKLFVVLCGIFITNAILAEMIGGKIFSLEKTLNISPFNFHLLGEVIDLNLTAGVILWPVVFIFTDIINEYFGVKGVKFITWFSSILIVFVFGIIYIAIKLSPAEFYVHSKQGSGIADMNNAFSQVFGQGLNIIFGSLTAFILGQLVDAFVFQKIKKRMGLKHIWFRATASTFVSQFIDSFLVLFIAFYVGSRLNAQKDDFIWPLKLVLALGLVNFIYKIFCAIILIPMLYLVHHFIRKYIGAEQTKEMEETAIKLN